MSFPSKILAIRTGVSSLSIILRITASEHGGNVYDCVAINSQGSFAATVMLLQVAPAFVQQPVDHGGLEVGDNVTLTCRAESHPPPMYQWERFNDTSQSFVQLAGETGTILQLMNVTVSDFGMYRCVVTAPEILVTIVSNTATISSECNT